MPRTRKRFPPGYPFGIEAEGLQNIGDHTVLARSRVAETDPFPLEIFDGVDSGIVCRHQGDRLRVHAEDSSQFFLGPRSAHSAYSVDSMILFVGL